MYNFKFRPKGCFFLLAGNYEVFFSTFFLAFHTTLKQMLPLPTEPEMGEVELYEIKCNSYTQRRGDSRYFPGVFVETDLFTWLHPPLPPPICRFNYKCHVVVLNEFVNVC